ncbi:family 16 glycosylhydrolase [Microbacterium kribbense]|uniref:family 16 glycosylhydrolase n=1 Tax=Microbacterium kribbense TaxID=433645 RepID=UPI0031DE5605
MINLDRRPDRWRRVRRELDRFRDRNGERLSSLVRRFSAVDARYMEAGPDLSVLIPTFTLADQLTVDPNPLLRIDAEARAREIQMTKQEIAVALSHIEVWRLIADGDVPSALVLEDDVFMGYGFAGALERTWRSLDHSQNGEGFDLLYLAFNEVGDVAPVAPGKSLRHLDSPGIWEASGYVISRDGARKLLDALPVFGPIDLWLNLQFERMNAYAASRPIIEQRIDEPSTNSYSVLPVLSQVGVITREKPLLPTAKQLPGPVIAVGDIDTGLTALGTALSMIGYTCLSDLDCLPTAEMEALLVGQGDRAFNAYVNIGSLDADAIDQIAATHPAARFIATSGQIPTPAATPNQVLRLTPDIKDKWAALAELLGVEYPAFPYPSTLDTGMRTLGNTAPSTFRHANTNLAFDSGPWILPEKHRLPGRVVLEADSPDPHVPAPPHIIWTTNSRIDERIWTLRDDTFPSNMALFTPSNVTQNDDEVRLELRAESAVVRDLTSGAIASVAPYRYGRFRAEFRPSKVRGLVTGMFLHRNGPRQEIDIEFLGKDTTKMLVNVFYNPGPEGTKLEYGYRGTPTVIDIGFDAAADFHSYEIDWQPEAIRWLVDGEIVYERAMWNPTPIPDQPLQFNFNLWHSRSKEFAGRLDAKKLPSTAGIRAIEIRPALGTDVRPHVRFSSDVMNC